MNYIDTINFLFIKTGGILVFINDLERSDENLYKLNEEHLGRIKKDLVSFREKLNQLANGDILKTEMFSKIPKDKVNSFLEGQYKNLSKKIDLYIENIKKEGFIIETLNFDSFQDYLKNYNFVNPEKRKLLLELYGSKNTTNEQNVSIQKIVFGLDKLNENYNGSYSKRIMIKDKNTKKVIEVGKDGDNFNF